MTICYNVLKHEEHPNLVLVRIDEEGFVSHILQDLYKRDVQSLMVEGGSLTHKLFFDLHLWDEIRVFTSTRCFGSGIAAQPVKGKLFMNERVMTDNLQIYYNE